MSLLKYCTVFIFSLFISVNAHAGKSDLDYTTKSKIQSNPKVVNQKPQTPVSSSVPHFSESKTAKTLDPRYKTNSQAQSYKKLANTNQRSPVSSLVPQKGSTSPGFSSKKGMVAIDEEEPVQAMPVQSSIQMNSTSSGFSSRNGMIAIDDEEPVQAMPAEIMQQQGQRSGFVRQ